MVGTILVILIMGFMTQRLPSEQNRFNIDSDACKPLINNESQPTQHEGIVGGRFGDFDDFDAAVMVTA